VAAGKTATDACQKALDLRGVKSTVVVAPPGAPDEAPYVAQAMALKPKAVVLSVLPSDIVKITTAFHQAGFTGPYASVITLYSAALAPSLQQTTDGAILGATFPPAADTSSSGLAQFRADAAKYGGSVALTEYTMDSYASVFVVAAVAKTITGPITRESFLKAMQAANHVEVPMLGTLNFATSAGVAGQPRLFNDKAVLVRFSGGAFKTIGTFFDPYAKS
jgi:ABC-type branched-subunit amino acid transport system substrate-binding protein